ncbi:MAG: B12-binding domain-containing radical SAM protein [Thermodesulfobacteriota bacterium]
MKALLVYPAIPDTFWSFKHVMKFISRKAAHPPLGLLTIAGMLPRDWDLKVVDMNVEDLTDQHIQWADLVFTGAMVVQKDSVRKVIDRCHVLGRKVVAGGPLFSSTPEDYEDVDYLVLNEAELTLQPFLNDLAQGTPRRIYTTEEKPDIRQTPLPRWDLIRLKDYASLSVQYSRGCPFNCEFCDIVHLNGRVPRVKSNDQMIGEFEMIYELGWRGSVFVVDDNFIGNKAKVKSLLREIIPWQTSRKHPFDLYTESSVNLAEDDELLELMASAGFDSVFLGLETPFEESLKECGKHQNMKMNLIEAVKKIQRHGMEVMGGFIIGFDNDPPNIFERQIKFIQNSGVCKAMIGLLNALPGTRLYERLKKEGRLIEGITGDNCDGSMNFIPKMDVKTLREGYQSVLKSLYSPKQYYQRGLEFLKTYRPNKFRRLDASQVMAFFKSVVYLGLLDKGKNKLYYWNFVIKAALFHRKAFGTAIAQAIFGYHFRRVLGKDE